MRKILTLAALVSLVLAGPSRFAQAADEAKPADPKAPQKITFDEHILPIFREHCLSCHNQNEAKSDLALDNFTRTMQGGAGGEVVIAGDLESSRLYALTSHAETPKMPPNQDRIPDAKLDLLKRWILGGALEHSGSKAKIKPKVDLSLKVTADNKPAGPAAMPEKFWRQPFTPSNRPGSSTAIAASPWAPLVAVAGQKQIILYNSDTAELVTIWAFPEGTPHVLKFSRDGSVLLAGGGRAGASGKVVLFDVKTGNRITEVGDELDVVLAADVNNSLSLVALGGPKRMVRVYSVADGSLQFEMKKHTDWINAAEFSPDGTLLATADRSGGLLIWESGNGREYQNLTGHTGGITDVSWRSDSKILASVSEDTTLKLWTIDNGKMLKGWNANRGAQSVEFGQNGNIVSAGRDNKVKVWDVDGKQIMETADQPDMVLDAVPTWDGARIVAGDWRGNCTVLDAKTGKPVGTLSLNPLPLEKRVVFLNTQIEERQKAAEAAAAEVERIRKDVAARQAAAKSAQDEATFVAAEIVRLTDLKPKFDIRVPRAQRAAQEAARKHGEIKQKLIDAEAGVKKTQETLKASPNSPQAKTLAQGAADRVVKLKADLAASEASRKEAEAELAATLKEQNETNKNLPALKNRAKPAKEAAEKALAVQQTSEKLLADAVAVAKAASEAVDIAKREAAQAAADKAEFDKLGNSQARAAN